MTVGELRKAGETLYGHEWQTALAHRLHIEARTVRRWVAGDSEIPGPAVVAIQLLLKYPQNA